MLAFFNLVRIFLLFVFLLPLFIFSKKRAIYLFLKFSGPSFIKLGQVLALRSDIVGIEVAEILQKFYDKLPPFSERKVKKIINLEFGKNFDEVFAQFDFRAVACASIAQVHKARLQTGQVVAVKILRPNIKKVMRRDIASLKLLAILTSPFSKFIKKFFLDIAKLLDEVARYELDLLNEAANASKLCEDLKNVKGFYVPEIFWRFSTSKILVLQWLDGIAFSDEKAIKESVFDKKQIAKNFVLGYFEQAYGNGFFHGDMHPGNLFLLVNGDIGVVDFGIMGVIDKKTRIAIAEIFIGFLNRDYKKVAQIHLDAGLVPKGTNIDDLALSCRKIGESIIGLNVVEIPIAKLLLNLIEMTRNYKMDARSELLLLQKTILTVEGVAMMLDLEVNIWDLARPWMKEWAKKNIGFDARIRDAALDLFGVLKDLVVGYKR